MKKKEAAGVAVYSVVKIGVIILGILGGYRLGSMAYSYGERLFGEPPMESAPGTDIVITVGSEDSVRDIADNLTAAGLIRDAGLFVLQERLAGYKEGVKAGTYTLNTSMTPEELIQTMAASSDEGDADEDNG